MFKVYILLLLFPFVSIGQIISYELRNTWSIFDVQDLYTSNNLPDYIGQINYDVEGYKVLYYTPNEDGDLVLAQGAVFLPVNTNCAAPILSWQHGTVVSDMGVPSQNIDDSNGIVFIYSQFIWGGIVPLALALEYNGFNKYSPNKTYSGLLGSFLLSFTIISSAQT